MKDEGVIYINGREISINAPTYFIADIASNHNGDLRLAKELIYLAKQSGADATKFQHFKASDIVSDFGFKNLGRKTGHQAAWTKSIYEIYEQYECNREWTEELVQTAKDVGIDFITTPYDVEAVTLLDPYIPAYKIGSGDITWTEFIEIIAKQGKPVMLATGASNMTDVERAVNAVIAHNSQLVLMQCNTNYTGSLENFRYINLRVLQNYAIRYPNLLLGLSDHTPGHASVLGAVTLGARVIEKHFTDDNSREGPDHGFSMNPHAWREMVERTRELELALGNGVKRIEENETETVIVQRRCLRLARDMKAGEKLERSDLKCLRPSPKGALEPHYFCDVLNKTLAVSKVTGDALYKTDLVE